jgi:hypothetical protein
MALAFFDFDGTLTTGDAFTPRMRVRQRFPGEPPWERR